MERERSAQDIHKLIIRSAIAQAEAGLAHIRNAKHYAVRLRFLQQLVLDKEVEFVYCPTDEQKADFMTKPLDVVKLCSRRVMILLFGSLLGSSFHCVCFC